MQPHPAPRRAALVALRDITKSFYGARANDGAGLHLAGGEIHALLGENGAGKSTLMNVLTGLYQPDSGTILIEGHPRRIESPAAAIEAGIGMVHQHFKLVPAFTVAENIHLGWDETPWRAPAALLEARTMELVRRFGLQVDPAARVADISAGEQQRVEILRVLARGARILILDEPTAVLTPPEVQVLFAALRAFRAQGNSVVLISHKLGEVLDIADHVTVMRAGRTVADCPTEGASRASLARLIVGETTLPPMPEAGQGPDPAAPVLIELRAVTVRDHRRVALLDAVDLQVRAGEILGVAGVAGNGQRALSEVLTGCRRPDAGEVLRDGRPAGTADARDFARHGIGHIPEDRLRTALAADLSLAENAMLREYDRPPVSRGRFGFSPARARVLARRMIDAAGVDRRDPDMPARNLSGGNQQRLVAEREARIATRVLVAAYPTRGLDIGAVAALHARMHALRARGLGVVLISEELEELLEHADRIAVLFAGRIAGILPAAEADAERLGLLMSGQPLAHATIPAPVPAPTPADARPPA